jgi:ribonucleoside-diphosphate reductase alpha chain
VSFMGMWNEAMNVVKQAGKRQGAMMGVLNVEHPDILKFIDAKSSEGVLTNFNISVGLSSDFMSSMYGTTDYVLPSGLSSRQLWDNLVQHAWNNGEPGVLFLDNINKNNPYDVPIDCVNPCGEIPIPAYGACCLGSINLNAAVGDDGTVRYPYLEHLGYYAARFMDATITRGYFVLPEIEAFERENRPLGIGVMGFADLCVKTGVRYGSSEARTLLKNCLYAIRTGAEAAADEMVRLYHQPRNKTLMSIAPTGTLAMIAECSYSIEPYFRLAYTKQVSAGDFVVVEPALRETLKARGLSLTKDDSKVLEETGSIQETSLPDDVKYLFPIAGEIGPYEHIDMQSAAQSMVDNAVSKTINLPGNATVSDVSDAFIYAHASGVKGLTVYRDKSRQLEVFGDCPSGACAL